jgi:membrane associated rhomboid family serine protease
MLPIVPLGRKGSEGIPILTIFICVACLVVFPFSRGESELHALAYHAQTADIGRMFTAVFAHVSVWHLLGNLFFFYSFARSIEARTSVIGYLLAFVVFVLVTNLAFSITAPASAETVGLSGVVWGFMGVFLFRYPRDKIECFVLFRMVPVPAFVLILMFLAFDIAAYSRMSDGRIDDGSVNYVAHFSGFLAGATFKLLFWKLFTTEEPEKKARAPFVLRPQGQGYARRRYR